MTTKSDEITFSEWVRVTIRFAAIAALYIIHIAIALTGLAVAVAGILLLLDQTGFITLNHNLF